MDAVKILDEFDKNWLISVLSSVGDGVITVDEKNEITYVNKSACEILELSLTAILHNNIDDLLKIQNDFIKSDESWKLKDWISWQNSKTGGLPKSSFLRTPNDEKKFISIHLTPIEAPNEKPRGAVIVIRDITKIVLAEQEAVYQRDSMVQMFYKLPIGMILIDRHLKILSANNSFDEMMGLTNDKVVGSVFGDAIQCVWSFNGGCGHSAQCLYCKFRERLKTYIELGKSFKNQMIEVKYIRENQVHSSWLNISFLPYKLRDEYLYLVSVEDYTDQINHEQKLEEARNSSLTLLNNLPIMIFKLNALMKCDYTNEAFNQFFSFEEQFKFDDIQKQMKPKEFESFRNIVESSFYDKSEFSLEFSLINKENAYRQMVSVGRPMYDMDGTFLGFLVMIFDVHDEKTANILYKKSQKKYFSLFQNMESSIFYFTILRDESNKIVDAEISECNPSARKLFRGLGDLIGKRLSQIDFLTRHELKETLTQFEAILGIGKSYHLNEYYYATLGLWMEVSVYSPDDNSVAVLITDIDEKKRTAIALLNEKERSEEANRIKSEFLANMSHEIRTPLNGIMGMIDLTLMEDLSDEQTENLVTAKDCVTSLIDIINDILDFSKIEAGKMKIEQVEFSLADLVDNTLKMHIAHLNEKELGLTIDLNEIYEDWVIGDSKRIKQVLNNLLSNAIKFTDEGSITLKVTQQRTGEGGNILTRFQVIDTGIGVEFDKQKLLFNSFTQIDGSYTRKYGGTGLGLVISKQLVEMMDGNISFQSIPQEGSIFEISLYLKKVEGDLSEFTSDEPLEISTHNKRILLVEDDKVNQIVMEKMMEKEGIQVSIAENGVQALKACNSSIFEMILMDIQMPIMDGIEATRQIRMNSKYNRLTPIVALTAFALKGDEDIFMASGMDGYISKPVDRKSLLKLLSEVLLEHTTSRESFLDYGAESFELSEKLQMESQESSILSSETVYELKHRVNKLDELLNREEYLVLEVNAHQLKVRFEVLKAEELKNIAFKIELELRKERYDKVKSLIKQLKTIIYGL